MAINRFFKPVDYEYTPIPFLELVTLGKYYADERKLAEKDLATYIQKANEFTSLISKDVDTYNKTAFNPQIRQYIDQAASNPSVMKDMAWRSGLQASMNAVDYGMLNKLKSSAEAAKVYDAAVKKLAIEGKMPPGWEPNYFDTYSTADSGVFNANPLAWQSKNDIVHKYVDNLKPSLIDTKGGWDYYGVSEERTLAQVNAAESEIMNLPVIQRNLQRRSTMYQLMGLSEEESFTRAYADEWGEIQNEAREKAWFDRRENKYSLLNHQAALAGRGDGAQSNLNTRIAEHLAQSESVVAKHYGDKLDGFAKMRKLNENAKFSDLTKAEQKEALESVVKEIQQKGLTKEVMSPLHKDEYYNWSGAMSGTAWLSKTSLYNKDGNEMKSGETYTYRNGDTVYTLDGHVVESANYVLLGGQNINVLLNDFLYNILNDAMYDMNGSIHPYNHGDGPNTLQTDGYIYVSEDQLSKAIDSVMPGSSSRFMRLFKSGLEDNSGAYYKIIEEVKGQIDENDNTVYRIRVGRDFGNVRSSNTDFNRNYIKDTAGSATVSKNWGGITASSWVEATSGI